MNKNKGFTLIELLVVIAIIGILAAVVMASLGTSKNKGNDSKVQSHLKSMIAQAQLYSGAVSAVSAPATAVAVPLTGGTNLFNNSTTATNSLYRLANGLPSGTVVYYSSNATAPLAGGFWVFAASTSTGSFCVDYTGIGLAQNTTVMTTAASGASSGATLYPRIADNSTYTCN